MSDRKSCYTLFPNDHDQDNMIKAGQSLTLPRPTWAMTAQGPAGVDKLLVLVTDSPRNLSRLGREKAGPFVQTLADPVGRANLQWLLGTSANQVASECNANNKSPDRAGAARWWWWWK